MADYLAVTDGHELTEGGKAVVAKAFMPRSEFPSGAGGYGVSPQDFGAVGDGVTNDSNAVQAALSAAAVGGLLRLTGTYYMGNTSLSATLSGPLSIQGNGTAKLVWDSGNGLSLTQNWANHTVTVDGVTLHTRAAGSGVALEIIGTGQNSTGANLRPRTMNRGSITRLNIAGATDNLTDGWLKGIRLVDVMNFFINQTHIDGYGTNTAATSTHGIEMVTNPTNAQAVDVSVSQCYVFYTQFGVDVQGYEGVLLDQCTFIAVGTGFRMDAIDAATPLATFTSGQIAFIDRGIEWVKMNQGVVSDSLIYSHGSLANTTGCAIELRDTTTTRITGCTFVSNPGLTDGVKLTGTSSLNVIESCTFYSTVLNPVNLGASATKNAVRNLNLTGTGQTFGINAGGPSNRIEALAKPPQLQYAPSGALATTLDRRAIGSSSLSALTSGTMLLTAVWVPGGAVITSATFVSGGSPASGFTNRWFALYDESRNLIRTTADNTAGWLPSTALTLPFSATYTVPHDRLLYIGICEVATTPTVLRGQLGSPTVIGLPPILCGNGSTGRTNAASTPAQAPALTVSSNLPYAYLS